MTAIEIEFQFSDIMKNNPFVVWSMDTMSKLNIPVWAGVSFLVS
jgi:hypothetical protein